MTSRLLINGAEPGDPSHALAVNDRGVCYGDGLFETALLRDGKVRFLDAHLNRLLAGCDRLGIAPPNRQTLIDEIAAVASSAQEGVLKVIVTRGPGGRGYRPNAQMQSTRVVALHPYPGAPEVSIAVRWCETRLGRNSRLAGLKHLNRLEQVLAQMEWNDPAIAEGLMLDTEGELVCGTASNVFIVRAGVLTTPDLRFCGVAGVMRGKVLEVATQLGIPSSEEPLWLHDLQDATEVFLTSSVRGVRSVIALETLHWERGPIALSVSAALRL